MNLKVWTYRFGTNMVATPVTRGRHPNPDVFSEARTYGVARSTSAAIESLLEQLGAPQDAEVEVIKFA